MAVTTRFNLDINGTEIRPVQHEFRIPHYKGSKWIIRLPTFPIEYADLYNADQGASSNVPSGTITGEKCQRQLRERGQKFSQLAPILPTAEVVSCSPTKQTYS
ncbi:uncharacterized protein RCC_09099 [Ramularia collo-cygni]|uniref:DUF7025 domain-containing protein n=1 Tax=Ramularia collo-cygni TaxID=112498 RepID=A0A2D3VCF7_9PEZI|nr:uncharacterized protein RCC_09099 [Ramularia collo-cygni]CZT23385.1 uncharacterized protein RCC_09099 [Ramularia collo-cygni]